jgi:O-antigen ligase
LKSKIINYLPYLVAIFVATNALFASFGKWLFAPEDVKTFVAMIGVFPFLVLWAVFYGEKNHFTIVKTKLYLPISLFLIWCFISLTYSTDSQSASYITYQYATMIAAFFLVANTFTTSNHIKYFLNFVLLIAFLISILAALQFYYPNNFNIQNFIYQAVKPAGTFGNKNMLGHFLVISFALSLTFAISSKTIKTTIIYTLLVVIFATMMIHINTRATWIASFVILFFMVVYLFKFKEFNTQFNTNKIIIFTLGIILWFGLINTNHNGFKWRFDGISDRISQTANTQNPRIPMWVNTLEMIKDNPLIGSGIGGWENQYIKYYDRVLKDSTFNENIRAERVHNEYLAMLAGVGIIGFLLFLWGVFYVFKIALNNLKNNNKEDKYLTLAITLAIIGFGVNAFFSFPIRVFFPGFLIMSLLGLLVVLQNKVKTTNNYFYFSKQFGYLLSVPIIMLGVIFSWKSYNILLSTNYYYESQALIYGNSSKPIIIDRLLKSVYHNPENADALSLLGERAIRSGKFEKGVDLVQKALTIKPYNDFSLLRLAMAYDVKGDKDNSIKTLHRILEFDKRNVKAHGQLARLYFEKGNFEKGQKHKKLMLKWNEYFKGRNGFGPYDKLIDYVEKTQKNQI